MSYETIRVRFQDSFCFLQLHRPQANNTIDEQLIDECTQVVARCHESTTVLVIEGLPDVFCLGADFGAIRAAQADDPAAAALGTRGPEPLFELWSQLASGPFVVVARVRGKVNAGGVGFVAASDIVLADESATFTLSELLFGLMPACVLPFLVRRVGFQRANYLTLMTQPIDAAQACAYGLVDACEPDSQALLRKHLLRLRRLDKRAIARYKRYASTLWSPAAQREPALAANREVFSDRRNLDGIVRYVDHGLFPWEPAS